MIDVYFWVCGAVTAISVIAAGILFFSYRSLSWAFDDMVVTEDLLVSSSTSSWMNWMS